MNFKRVTAVTTTVIALLLCLGRFGQAQDRIYDQRFATIGEKLAQLAGVLDGLPESSKKRLSSGAQNLLKLAHGWDDVEGALENALTTGDKAGVQSLAVPDTTADPAAVTFPISNLSADFLFSIMAGLTQSETSTAWCGNNVVVGFNDSGSFFESLVFGAGGASFSGASISSNKGTSFRDVGFINPGTDFNNFLAGDPVVTCALVSQAATPTPTFFYTQLFELGPTSAPLSGIAFSKSFDGGASWSSPVAAVQKDGRTHFLDKDWSAVDPNDPNRIFITYTDFDQSGTSGAPPCGIVAGVPVLRLAIELVRSSDGGATWSAPLVIAQGCNRAPNFPQVQGSQVAVDSAGSVYVAWESFLGASGTTRALLISKSTNNGSTFGVPVTISNVIETGDGSGLQGGFRNNEFPLLAIDRSSGALWVVWNDGRNFAIRDSEAPDGLYHFADILFSRSITGGASWSPPALVSPPQIPHLVGLNLLGNDHYQPGIAVDKTGAAAVCWYDRRSDPANFRFGRACSISTNSGLTWTQNFFINGNWSPWHATDVFVNPFYLGDYDTVGSDFLQVNSGFLGAFGFVNTGPIVPNQDVAIFSIP